MPTPKFPIDFNLVRITLARCIQSVTLLSQNNVIMEEPESQNWQRPSKPYFSIKMLGPAAKSGDDDKRYLGGDVWNSGGVRKMTIEFNCYGQTHEDAYNYMTLWQTALDQENVQEALRQAGIAVWIIGNVADLSQLLNTGFEGRSHLECTFGIAANITSNIGEMDSVVVDGKINTGTEDVNTITTAP